MAINWDHKAISWDHPMLVETTRDKKLPQKQVCLLANYVKERMLGGKL